MNTLNVNLENLSESERQQLTSLIKKSQKKKPLRCEPQKSNTYYILRGGRYTLEYCWNDDDYDKELMQRGNVFRKRETVEQVANKHQIVNKIAAFVEQFDDGWVADWENWRQEKYFVCFNHKTRKYEIMFNIYKESPEVPYMSKACAQALCDALNNGEYEL